MPGTVWTWAAASDAAVPSAASRRPRRGIRFNSFAPWDGLAPILPGRRRPIDRLDRPGDGGVQGGAALVGAGRLRIPNELRIHCERCGRVVDAGMLHLPVVRVGNEHAIHLFCDLAKASEIAAVVAQQHDGPEA